MSNAVSQAQAYVERMRAKGRTDGDIRAALFEAGWATEQIDLLMPGPPQLAPEQRFRLFHDLVECGRALREAGRPDEALAKYNEALPIVRNLVVDDPGFGQALSSVLSSCANALSDLGRVDEAVVLLDEALALCREPARTGDVECRYTLAYTLINRSAALMALERLDEALGDTTEALTVCEELFASSDPVRAQMPLANLHGNRGTIFWRMGRLEDAVESYTHSVAHFTVLSQFQPEHKRAAALAVDQLNAVSAELRAKGTEGKHHP